MSKKKLSKEKSLRRTKLYAQALICLSILGVGFYFVRNAYEGSGTVGQSPFRGDTEIETTLSPATEAADPDKILYGSSIVPTKDKFRGDLILVNGDRQYFGGGEDLVSILEKNDETGRDFFTAVNYDYTILGCVYEPMATMISDFYDKYHNDTLSIYGSYRTTEFQQQLYEEDLAATGKEDSDRVAKPGFSEHETGYAFDFTETVNNDYDGTGDFAWINENCYKYGFILRYPEDKVSVTKYRYEPWHFRYVGIPHAYYMTKNKLCLEEYIDLLREHPYDGDHLEFRDDDGKSYEAYFVPSDDGSDTTTVPIPNGKEYTVSGNNVDGFIVTVYADGIPELMKYEPEKSSDDDSDDAAGGDDTDGDNQDGGDDNSGDEQ